MPSAIVTGATGYIGSHVVKRLVSNGWKVGAVIRPSSDTGYIQDLGKQIEIYHYNGDIDSLIAFFQHIQADVVMHLAAAVITNPHPKQVSTIIDSNIRFGTEILEAMRHSSTKLIISTGTYWQNYDGTNEYNPVDLYAASKEAFEKIVKFYVEAYGFRHINLRLFDVYGEDDKRPKLWNLLRTIAGTERSIDTTLGEQKIEMVYIDDVVSAFEKAYEWLCYHPELKNEIYGVNSLSRLTLKETILLYQTILHKDIKINWGARPYEQREVMNPCKSYQSLPNWRPKTTLESGFTKLGGGVNALFIMPLTIQRA